MHQLLKIHSKDLKVGKLKGKISYKIWIINSVTPKPC